MLRICDDYPIKLLICKKVLDRLSKYMWCGVDVQVGSNESV